LIDVEHQRRAIGSLGYGLCFCRQRAALQAGQQTDKRQRGCGQARAVLKPATQNMEPFMMISLCQVTDGLYARGAWERSA
jgi:hypothetical protein